MSGNGIGSFDELADKHADDNRPSHAQALRINAKLRTALDALVVELVAEEISERHAESCVAMYAGRYCGNHFGASMFGPDLLDPHPIDEDDDHGREDRHRTPAGSAD